jgi:hypothetical protein
MGETSLYLHSTHTMLHLANAPPTLSVDAESHRVVAVRPLLTIIDYNLWPYYRATAGQDHPGSGPVGQYHQGAPSTCQQHNIMHEDTVQC